MPSPESPANRMTTDSSCSTGLATTDATLAPAPVHPSALVPAHRRGERGEPVKADVGECQEAAQRDHEPDQLRVAEGIAEPAEREVDEEGRPPDRIPAVEAKDAAEVDPHAGAEERAQSRRPAADGAGG